MPVALGLDVGERRIGVARSDAWGLLATPLTTVLRTSDRAALAAIARLAAESGATLLVVGVPYGEAGELTPQARRVTAFSHKLSALPGVSVVFSSERFSTAEAGERLRASGARRGPAPSARRREADRRREDAAAAAVILQEFLDQQASEPSEGP